MNKVVLKTLGGQGVDKKPNFWLVLISKLICLALENVRDNWKLMYENNVKQKNRKHLTAKRLSMKKSQIDHLRH